MKPVIFTLLSILCFHPAFTQTPVPMASQTAFSYTETFADISNWTFSASNDGTFSSGNGASAWKGLPVGGSGTIPNGTNITTRSNVFTTGTSGGVQKGTQNLVLLSTGTTDNSSSV